MGIAEQGGRPTGKTGTLLGMLMNRVHTPVYTKCLDDRLPPDGSVIVDIGCGGGKVIKYLSERNATFELIGLDHSPEMVALSQKTNRLGPGTDPSRVRILCASVAEIPLGDATVDMVTAFETVQFWPDTDKSFCEIARVLRSGGTFLLMNRYPPEGSAWWKRAKLKSDQEYESVLSRAGFAGITTDLNSRKGWIVATARK